MLTARSLLDTQHPDLQRSYPGEIHVQPQRRGLFPGQSRARAALWYDRGRECERISTSASSRGGSGPGSVPLYLAGQMERLGELPCSAHSRGCLITARRTQRLLGRSIGIRHRRRRDPRRQRARCVVPRIDPSDPATATRCSVVDLVRRDIRHVVVALLFSSPLPFGSSPVVVSLPTLSVSLSPHRHTHCLTLISLCSRYHVSIIDTHVHKTVSIVAIVLIALCHTISLHFAFCSAYPRSYVATWVLH